MPRYLLPVAVAFVLLALPAFALQPSSPTSPVMSGMTGGHSGADQAMMEGMSRMNQAMSGALMSGDPDRDFVAMMIPHHQGAIDMAKTELQYGKNPVLRKMARDVVTAQEKEIAKMKRWQTQHPVR